MGRKCKICGYRFKSRDEAICPECFTAREDDISCERYSANEHSHAKSYSSGLRDTSESLVQKEMREERRNSFARENFGARANAGIDLSDDGARFNQQARFERDDYNYDFSNEYRQIMAQSYPQKPPARQQSVYDRQRTQQQGSAYQRYTAQQQRKQSSTTSGFTPAGQIFAQRSALRTSSPYTASRTQQKKNSAGAAVFLILFIVICVMAAVISNIQDRQKEKEWENNYNYTYTYTTKQKTTTASTTTKKAASTTKTTDKKTASSTSGHFSVTLSEVTYEKKNKLEIDKKLLGAATTTAKGGEPWEVVTLKVKLSAGSKALADPHSSVIQTVTLQGLENADAHNTLSYSVDSPKTAIDITNDVETTVTLLVHQDAKVIYFNIYLQNSGMTEQCRFNIHRD